MFQKILTSALFAGFCAGLIAALLQIVFVQPVLLHAELYESGRLVHFGAAPVSAAQDVGGFDLVRDGLSILFTMLSYTGFALLMVTAMALAANRGIAIDARHGMYWGIAGFVAVVLAPAFSLPPEVPGVAAGELFARQIWWTATVAATVLAMALIAFGKGPLVWIAAAVLLLAPQWAGAPHPDSFAGPVPPEIASLFTARGIGTGMAGWVLLGIFSGYFWQRETASA